MFRPLTALGSLLVLAVFLLGAATVDAQAPTSITLVSNNGQTTMNDVVFDSDLAIPFGTGSSSNGYKLTSVQVYVSGFAQPSGLVSTTFTVSIHTGSGTSVGASVGTLSSSTLSTGTNTFSSADGIDLDPDTSYSVVLDITSPGSKDPKLWLTSSQHEDSGGAPGWTIGNMFYFRSSSTWASTVQNRVPKITIEGYTIPAPKPTSAVVDGRTLTLTFDKALDADSEPGGGRFSVKATRSSGAVRTIAGTGTADVSGMTVTVTLASAIAVGETVTVSYSKPTQNRLRAAGGGDAPNFTNQTVINLTGPPRLTAAAVNGWVLTLTFHKALDAAFLPLGQQFTLSATRPGGTVRTVPGTGTAAVSGSTATVTLMYEIVEGETVTVSYAKPAENPLRSTTGEDVAAFAGQTVSNNTPAPTSSSLVSNTGQVAPNTGDLGQGWDQAQAFTTGSGAAGYKLTGVTIDINVPSGADTNVSVEIWTRSSLSTPGSRLATLTNPSSVVHGWNTFTAAGDGLDLAPSTTYFVVLDVSSSTAAGMQHTTSHHEDAGSDWSIANGSLFRATAGSSWVAWAHSRIISPQGYQKNPYGGTPPEPVRDDQALTPPEDTISAPEVKFGRRTPGEQYQFNGQTRTVGSDGSWLMRHCVIYDRWGNIVKQIWGGTGPCP